MNGWLYRMVASGLSVSILQHTEGMEVKLCGFLLSTSREISDQLHAPAT
jgi:hypothetical protein